MRRTVVNGHGRYLSDLPQGGLELPCVLRFMTMSSDEGKKAKKLIESTLCVEVSEVPLPAVSVSTDNTVEEKSNDMKELRMSPVVIPEQQAEECVMLPQKKKAKCMDLERIVMGEQLCDRNQFRTKPTV